MVYYTRFGQANVNTAQWIDDLTPEGHWFESWMVPCTCTVHTCLFDTYNCLFLDKLSSKSSWLQKTHASLAIRKQVFFLSNLEHNPLGYSVLEQHMQNGGTKTYLFMKFFGFSTPTISFWLICTTRRWDRGSMWGHTLFLSELKFP